MKVPGILKNKYVFYALAVLAVLNVVGYVTVQAWECLALFALTACCAHTYCKDKSCSILAALFVSNFVFGCGRIKEGFQEATKGVKEHLEDAESSARAAAAECSSATSKDDCEDLAKHAKATGDACVWDASGNTCA